jgi:hypothetical protein
VTPPVFRAPRHVILTPPPRRATPWRALLKALLIPLLIAVAAIWQAWLTGRYLDMEAAMRAPRIVEHGGRR